MTCLAGAQVPPAADEADDRHWIADANGCKVINPRPRAGESIAWSGKCENGLATGEGMLERFLHGQPNGNSTGTFREGRLEGKGVRVFATGNRLESTFVGGRPDGPGKFTYANGMSFQVAYINGNRSAVSPEEYRFLIMEAGRPYIGYPREAIEKKLQGRVVVRLSMKDNNRTIAVRESSGVSLLDERAVYVVTHGSEALQLKASLLPGEFFIDIPITFSLEK